jgi:hypothetical protein
MCWTYKNEEGGGTGKEEVGRKVGGRTSLTGNKFVEGIHGKFVPGKTGSPLPVDVIEGDHLAEVRRKERGRTTDSEGRKGETEDRRKKSTRYTMFFGPPSGDSLTRVVKPLVFSTL